MGHTADKRLEHAEHTQHAAHDPFDRKVAMTMTIMAAILAGVTLVSHRGHTDTLRLATEASTLHTKASDKWNEYQAKNIRSHEYQAFAFLEALVAKDGIRQDEESKALRNYWLGQIDKYEGKGYFAKFKEDLKHKKAADKPAPTEEHGGTAAKDHGDDHGTKDKSSKRLPGAELDKLFIAATALEEQGKQKEHESHELHGDVTWIDLGHLGLEMALVFCAVAVLTKQKSFWMTGITLGAAGTVLAAVGVFAWLFISTTAGGHH